MLEEYAGLKLCIIISKNDKYEGIVLYELLLEIAFNSRLSAGTVTIGDKGFLGTQDESTRLKILRSAENLPVVLEFQGRPKRIERYIERIQPLIKEGLLTRSEVLITKFTCTDLEVVEPQEEENEHQSQMFDEAVEEPVAPEPQPVAQDSPASGDDIEKPTPQEAFSGHDDHTPEPEFVEMDQDQTPKQNESDFKEPDIPIFDDEDDDDPVLQLADLSETPAEENDDDFEQEESPEDLEESPADVGGSPEDLEEPSLGAEPAETDSDDEFDKLFDESNEKFEDTFDEMFKEVGGANVVDKEKKPADKAAPAKEAPPVAKEAPQSKKTPEDSGEDEQAEPTGKSKKEFDTSHTEDEMKNYFSELFKK